MEIDFTFAMDPPFRLGAFFARARVLLPADLPAADLLAAIFPVALLPVALLPVALLPITGFFAAVFAGASCPDFAAAGAREGALACADLPPIR